MPCEHNTANTTQANTTQANITQQPGVPVARRARAEKHPSNLIRFAPAQDVKKLLRDGPEVRGLSVPGMPVGSPGMEQGGRVEPYEVVTFTPSGETSVFSRYGQ